jgi:hypothetical protein
MIGTNQEEAQTYLNTKAGAEERAEITYTLEHLKSKVHFSYLKIGTKKAVSLPSVGRQHDPLPNSKHTHPNSRLRKYAITSSTRQQTATTAITTAVRTFSGRLRRVLLVGVTVLSESARLSPSIWRSSKIYPKLSGIWADQEEQIHASMTA